MKKALKGLAQDVSQGLVGDLANHRLVNRTSTRGVIEVLFQQLADEVVRQVEATKVASVEDLETRLQAVESELERLGAAGDGLEEEEENDVEDGDQDDEDEVDGTGSSLPNLKYAKPKYKDVESILRYVESEDGPSGVKLVIMNFND